MSKKVLSVLICAVLILLTACSATPGTASAGTIAGRDGTAVTVPAKIERIISGAPAITEILVGLGLGDKLVAADTFSADVEGINGSLPLMDTFNPDAEKFVTLKPDLVLVLGSSSANNDPYKALRNASLNVVYIPSSDSIQGVMDDITFIAQLTGTAAKGKEIIYSMKTEIAKIKAIGDTVQNKKSVYLEISPAPNIYTPGKGTFLNEMITLIGAENIFGDKDGWIAASGESVAAKNPSVILTNVTYVKDPVAEIKARAGWNKIDAVKDGQVFTIDVNSSSRPSQYIIKALRQMAQAVYPELYED